MNKNTQIKIGIALILFSGVAFAVMLIIPMLDIDSKQKVIGSTTAFVAMEVLFYAGGFLVGKELFKKYKSYLNPKNWFSKKEQNGDQL
jgi:hypothetical protein